jgi:hypothetical protein
LRNRVFHHVTEDKQRLIPKMDVLLTVRHRCCGRTSLLLMAFQLPCCSDALQELMRSPTSFHLNIEPHVWTLLCTR